MITINTIEQMRAYVLKCKEESKSIGLVPTMGYLHAGHVSLIEKSVSQNDVTIVSIFVNPTQFAPNEDLEKYPRDLLNDEKLVTKAGADVIFNPFTEEIYPTGYKTYVNVEDLTSGLCGVSRPIHFRGVTTIVCKLFNIVEPTRAYFGQKDAQQLLVIKKMVSDLNMNVEVVACPIIREADGLAMSSRNVYLSNEERSEALVLSKSLCHAKEAIMSGETSADKLHWLISSIINTSPLSEIDYIEIVSADTLEKVDNLESGILIALAVRFGKTRLIDNIIIGGQK